jgi:hypothetical protein
LQIAGADTNSLNYHRGSIFHQEAREKYMLKEIISNGGHAVFLVGSGHMPNLAKLINNELPFNVISFTKAKFDYRTLSYDNHYSADNTMTIYIDKTSYESNGQQSPEYNIDLSESMLSIRNGIEFVPVLHYFIKEIIYPITKDIVPTQIADTKLFELNSYVLSATHLGASYIGAMALNVASPLEASLKASSSLY